MRALISVVIALLAVSLGGCSSSPASSFYRLKRDTTLTAMGAPAPLYVSFVPSGRG